MHVFVHHENPCFFKIVVTTFGSGTFWSDENFISNLQSWALALFFRFALRSALIFLPRIAIALALILQIFRFAQRSIALKQTCGSLLEKSGRNSIRSSSFDICLGCPAKPVSIRNNRKWNRNKFWHYPKQNFCFGCFASLPKQRISVFRLNRSRKKINRKTESSSTFWID